MPEREVERRKVSFKEVVNDALRAGLTPVAEAVAFAEGGDFK